MFEKISRCESKPICSIWRGKAWAFVDGHIFLYFRFLHHFGHFLWTKSTLNRISENSQREIVKLWKCLVQICVGGSQSSANQCAANFRVPLQASRRGKNERKIQNHQSFQKDEKDISLRILTMLMLTVILNSCDWTLLNFEVLYVFTESRLGVRSKFSLYSSSYSALKILKVSQKKKRKSDYHRFSSQKNNLKPFFNSPLFVQKYFFLPTFFPTFPRKEFYLKFRSWIGALISSKSKKK